jgi:dienelactone hydrolase
VARFLYGAAGLLLLVAFLGLRRATQDVTHYPVVLATGAPARVYEPGPPRSTFAPAADADKVPAVAIAHGFSGTSGMMSALARALARAGYLAVTLDLTGHGQNPGRFDESFGEGRAKLIDDVQAAVEFLRSHARVDAERVGVIGHSMGAGAVLQYGARDPSVGAVVPISGGFLPRGPYPPPNVFVIFAEGDPGPARERLRELAADLAGLERVVADRTYGDPSRGTALRLSEVARVNHLTILYSREAWRRVIAWLHATLGPEAAAVDPPPDGRFLWSGLGLLAFLVLLWGAPLALAPLAPRVPLPQIDRPLRVLMLYSAALLLGALLLGGVDFSGARGPFSFLPLVGARDTQGFFGISGLAMLALALPGGRVERAGLEHAGTWFAAFALFAFTYLVAGTLLQPFTDPWLSPARAPWFGVAAALALPFFGGAEWLLRGEGARGVWLPVLGKALALLAIFAGALLGLLPRVLLLATLASVGLFALLEFAAYRLSRTLPSPWLAALYQSLLAAWIPAATFPLTS